MRERIAAAVPGTMLAYLLDRGVALDPHSAAPWLEPACLSAASEVRTTLEHARLFSLAIQGAALLYNLLVGKQYEDHGYTRQVEPVARYQERLSDWASECADAQHQLARWNRADFWEVVQRGNPRINPLTHGFVSAWLDAVCTGRAAEVTDAADLRDLVERRERAHKKSQSRLTNERLLRTWTGAAGSGRLTYRWNQVHRIVADVLEGLDRDAGA